MPLEYLVQIAQDILREWTGSEWGIAAVALAFSAAIAAISWMIAEALRSPQLKGWAKREVKEFFFTAVIIGSLLLILAASFGITYSLTGENYFESARSHLNELYEDNLRVGVELTAELTFYTLLSSIKLDLAWIVEKLAYLAGGAPGVGLTILRQFVRIEVNPLSPYALILSPLTTLSKMAFTMMFVAIGQLKMLEFFEGVALVFILPLGIVMRAFPLTRKTGSTLIALSITAYFVYPITVNLGKVIYDEMKTGITEELRPSIATVMDVGGNINAQLIPPVVTEEEARTEEVKWNVYLKNGSYRIWHSEDDKCLTQGKTWACLCHFAEGELTCETCREGSAKDITWMGGGEPLQQPPYNPASPGEWQRWEISYTTAWFPKTKCYDLIRNGKFEELQEITYPLSNVGMNKSHSFVLDIYEKNDTKYVAAGFEESHTYVGTPKEDWGLFRKISAIIFGEQTEITVGETGAAVASGFTSAIGNIARSGLVAGFEANPMIIFPPLMATGTFLSYSERLPVIIIPTITTLFTLVISATISISAFKGISTSIGGEEKIAGLAKLI